MVNNAYTAHLRVTHCEVEILENVNSVVRNTTGLKLWRNTLEVIDWFKTIENKDKCGFIEFDVLVEFYPSITEQLLRNAIEWAQNYVCISLEDTKVIIQSKRSLLCCDGEPWTKKGEEFDVAMGSYDGAECCELVGLFMLSQMQGDNMSPGLYRDDGLIICNGSSRSIENTRKNIINIYKRNNLRITSNANIKKVNFLDITLDLNTGSFGPYLVNLWKKNTASPVF